MINDVTDAFDGWLETVTGVRTTGNYVSGRWVDDTPSALSFLGVVQNAKPQDLLVLEEANRVEEAIKIHTTFFLIANVPETTKGDLITYKGDTWMVFNLALRYIGNYNKAILIKQ